MTDAELLAAGDADSFAEFYRRHSRRVAGYLMRATGDAEAAAEHAAPAAWLFGIAAHKLNDWRRRGYAEDRARRRLRMERPQLSADDVREIEQLGAGTAISPGPEECPRPSCANGSAAVSPACAGAWEESDERQLGLLRPAGAGPARGGGAPPSPLAGVHAGRAHRSRGSCGRRGHRAGAGPGAGAAGGR